MKIFVFLAICVAVCSATSLRVVNDRQTTVTTTETTQATTAPANPTMMVSHTALVVPAALQFGAEVVVPCSECVKLISKYVQSCVEMEAYGTPQITSFISFCEPTPQTASTLTQRDREYCLVLNSKMAAMTGETGMDLVDPTKAPSVCARFKVECEARGGPPHCFSGFCDEIAECIDCPYASLDLNGDGYFEPEVCGDAGICRLGWKDPVHKGGNGYCDCLGGMKGLSCNEQ
eukprot:GILI01003396.1.p1 GENE.GILI01003396.1~~GILI01003396.1.p1  ORF type:complete len:232 (+),score=41.74 GILI01003396.1:85-780(+)